MNRNTNQHEERQHDTNDQQMVTHLQQLRDDGQHLRVADVDGFIPVGLPLIADVPQVEDGRQQGENPETTDRDG